MTTIVFSVMLSLLLSGELRNLVGSILGGQTGSNISLEQVRMVGEGEGGRGGGGESGGGRQEEGGRGRVGEGRGIRWGEGRLKQITQQQEQQEHQSRAGGIERWGRNYTT